MKILILLITCFLLFHLSNSLIIETANGKVEGAQRKSDSQNRDVYYFLGVPFAEPPITEELRFERPKPKASWSGTLNCTQYKDQCVQAQPPLSGSEDCLYINIYTPINPLESTKKLPVLFWIHGGTFLTGNGYMNYTLPDPYLDQDTVFVSIQYRLGILGFGSSGDGVMPENVGLRDQILALEWTSKNIKYFGGDEKNLALLGGSAGAASVSLLMQTKQTAGLFQRAIMDSGTSMCLWALSRKSAKITKAVAALLGINIFDSKAVLKGLKKADLKRLIETSWNAQLTEIQLTAIQEGLVFAPMIESSNSSDAVIRSGSYDILDKGDYNKVPILLGTTSLEANTDITFFIRLYLLQFDAISAKLVPRDMNAEWFNLIPAGNKIKEYYFGLSPIALSNIQILREISDDFFSRPILETVKLHSKHQKAYLYWFAYEGQLTGNINRSFPGVGHGEDAYYAFDVKPNGSPQDRLVEKRVQTLWGNFAKFGNPTPETNGLLENVIWPQAYEIGKVEEKVKYLNISKDLVPGEDLQGDTMRFWRKLYKDYGRPPFNTF